MESLTWVSYEWLLYAIDFPCYFHLRLVVITLQHLDRQGIFLQRCILSTSLSCGRWIKYAVKKYAMAPSPALCSGHFPHLLRESSLFE